MTMTVATHNSRNDDQNNDRNDGILASSYHGIQNANSVAALTRNDDAAGS
jgi:hypothetical protein